MNYSQNKLAMKFKSFFLSKILLTVTLLFISLFLNAQVPETLPVKLLDKSSKGLMLSAQETSEAKYKIQNLPWARSIWMDLKRQVDRYVEHPLYFPEGEGGWIHDYVCPLSGARLQYDRNSPHKHFCPVCKKFYEGVALDRAWNSMAMNETAGIMEQLAVACILSDDLKYMQALGAYYLDVAEKYDHYRVHDRSFNLFGDKAGAIAGRAMSQSIDECNLLTKLAFSYDVLQHSNVLSKPDQEIIKTKLWGNANTLLHRILDLHPSGGNWWVWHSAGGLVVGLFTDDKPLIDQAINDPKTGILKMIRSGYLNEDGIAGENSSGYQLFAMMAITRMAIISKHLEMGFENIPSVQKAFTAMTSFTYPDLTLPNMNDSRRSDLKMASNPETDNFTYPDLLEAGYGIYHSESIISILSDIYNNTLKPKRTSLYALLYGPSNIPVVKKVNNSSASVSAGIVLLRSPDHDWNALLKNTSPSVGHAHPNMLQVAMFANGEEFIPSFGSPEYGHPSYRQWYTHTLAHNTININMKDQNRLKTVRSINWSVLRGPVNAVQGQAANVQPVLNGDDSPIEIIRTLVISPLAIYDLFDVTHASQLKTNDQKVNILDWVMHFNGKINWSSPPKTSDKTIKDLSPENTENSPAYGQLSDIKLLQTGSTLRGDILQPKGGKVAFSFFKVQADENDFTAFGPGYESSVDVRLPIIIRRVNSSAAQFGGVYIPYRDKNPLLSVNLLQDRPTYKVIKVNATNGSEVLFNSQDLEKIRVEKLSFEGTMGTITSINAHHKLYFLLGKSIADEQGSFESSTVEPVVLTVNGNNVDVRNYGSHAVTITWRPVKGQIKKMHIEPVAE